ncbi:MAG TPA: PAS domain-containing sensor histidine kinase, partial [Gemmatimonadaceae bacterium]
MSCTGDGDGASAPGSRSPTPPAWSGSAPREYLRPVEELVRRLTEAEEAIQSLAAGQIDAIVDPATATPILLGQAQDALARSESRYRDLVDRTPAIVCELAPDGRVTFVNESVRAILGVAPERLAGRDWWRELVPAEHAAAAELSRLLERTDVTAHELPARAADGGIRWIAWNSANRWTPDGRLDSIVLFGADVTGRREAEEAARLLGEAQVAQAQAEAANRAKTDFLAAMSHELRTPLNAIAGYVQLLEMGLRGPVTPEQVLDLHKIRRSQQHLLGLINDIMNFARLEAGRVTIHAESVALRGVLETIQDLTQLQVRARGLEYDVAECGPEVRIWADREKVQQIVLNLVSNAIKFTEPGGRVAVEVRTDDAAVHVDVRDTGRGIPADKLESIFEPFVQVNRHFSQPHD